jgi:hypothetical protein
MLMQFLYKGILDTVGNNTDKILSLHSFISNLLGIYSWENPNVQIDNIDIRNQELLLFLREAIVKEKVKSEYKLSKVRIDENSEEEEGVSFSLYFKDIYIRYGIGRVDNDRASDVIYIDNIDTYISDKKQISDIFCNFVSHLKPKKAIFADSDFLFDHLEVKVGELWPGNLVYLSNEIDIPDFEHPEVEIESIDNIGRIYKLNPDLGYDTEECKQILAEMYEHFKKHIDYFV